VWKNTHATLQIITFQHAVKMA